ncbi:MAG: SDR family NAD(P)-dependent oxidoreductase, partial [Acidobacteria bacterium]|nr:SDR family NAD(P)-dependent oxidoreductase [Candidatus Sulfomarinibacter kjeldsenii]
MAVDLDGKNVLVTGASSGIGHACAEAFAERGCRLLLAARRKDRLDELASTLRARHEVEVLTTSLDVRDSGAVESWVGGLTGEWRGIDILVNNAGLSRGIEPLHEGDISDWEEMIDTNLKGLLYVTRAVLPGMVDRGHGHVINIGSIAGHEVYPGGNVYCATKHAVTALNRGLAIDTLGTGVRVSSVDPGIVETEFSLVRFHGDAKRASGVYDGLDPLTPADVAEAVLFCATRPKNANVREMILTAGAQASAV